MTTTKKPTFIALYRVSTKVQADSDLGLKAQKSAVQNYIKSVGGVLLNEYKEVESAGNKEKISYGQSIDLDTLLNKRQVFLKALEEAHNACSVLIVKEVTRLTRSSLVFEYMKATGVKFLCTDYPNDNTMMLGLRVQFGEEELLQISKRTIAGLSKSTKAKGTKALVNLAKVNHKKRIDVLRSNARNNRNNIKASGYICQLIKSGSTLQQVADVLNKEGFKTARSKAFKPTTVQRLYERFC